VTTFVALLRAVNVGGTGKLPMADLTKLCENAGCTEVKTYIQSGNVVFRTQLAEAKLKMALEKAVATKVGKRVGVLLRRGADLDRALADNPFGDAPPNRVIVMFYEEALPKAAIANVKASDGEELALHGRELFIHYPNGQGRSKLKVPNADLCTGRNLNTVTKLAGMAREIG
jgi:uncharacterized protein (DUF1697 family)